MDNTKKVNIKRKKRSKIKYNRIILLLLFLGIIAFCIYKICNVKIKNIFISGNSYLTDQQVIDLSGLSDYPTIVSLNTKKIENKINENIFIKKVRVKYKNFRQEIYIEIEENIPVLYYLYDEKTLLSSYDEIDYKSDLPVLINQTPDRLLNKLVDELYKLDDDIVGRISEIKYSPTKVDEELFLLTMNDGYYVYINFNSFHKLDNYVEIIKSFDNKKGIIHLDSGDYLDIYDENKDKDKDKNKTSNKNQISNSNNNVSSNITSNSNNNSSNTNTSNSNTNTNNEDEDLEELEEIENTKYSNTNKSNQN